MPIRLLREELLLEQQKMINKINITQINRVGGIGSQNNKANGTKKQSLNDTDVQFSLEANMLQAMLDTPETEVSPAKLDSLKQAITQGEYKIDYDKLVDTLVDQSYFNKD